MSKRRGQNEGSICKRSDGRWVAVLNLGYVDGKRRRKSFYGDTRKEVAGALAKALREQQQGIQPTNDRQTVEQYLTHWLETAKQTVRETSIESYERRLRRDVYPHLGRIVLSKLTPQDLADCYTKLLISGLSPSTVQRTHAILHRALKQATRWGLVPRNVADLVDAPRPARHELVPLGQGDLERFLDLARGDRFHALYVLAIMTGLREGELLGLKWADLDLEARELHVRRQVGRTKSGVHFSEPKTAKGRRTVALPDIAIAALKEHRHSQLVARLEVGPDWQNTDLIFPSQHGTPIEKQNLARRSFKPLLAKAGLPATTRFHDLRHAHATLLLSQGVHPKVVQERLGHSTISVTMDVYSHVMPQLQRDAADTLGKLFVPKAS